MEKRKERKIQRSPVEESIPRENTREVIKRIKEEREERCTCGDIADIDGLCTYCYWLDK